MSLVLDEDGPDWLLRYGGADALGRQLGFDAALSHINILKRNHQVVLTIDDCADLWQMELKKGWPSVHARVKEAARRSYWIYLQKWATPEENLILEMHHADRESQLSVEELENVQEESQES